MTQDILYGFLLAQVLGLYYLITAVIALYRADYYRKVLLEFKGLDYNGVYAALTALLVGLFLALTQNNLYNRNQIVLTIVTWSILLKAICLLLIPEKTLVIMKRAASGHGYYVANLFYLLLGCLLCGKGFYLFALRSGIIA